MSNTDDKNSLKQSKDVKTVIQLEKNTEEETFTKKRLAYLEHKLALLESVQQKKQIYINKDTQIPLIDAKVFYDSDTNATIEGYITDNVEIAEVIINNQILNLSSDGFLGLTFIPRSGKTIVITAFDIKGNKSIKSITIERKEIQNTLGPLFSPLNPSGNTAKINSNALALIIGVSNYDKTSAKALYADNDAQTFYDFANLKLGVPKTNIMELINEKAEESDILLAVKDWVVRSTKNGVSDIYLFFAGHGLASSDGDDMYLLPYDGSPELLEDTAILRDKLFKELSLANPRTVTVFLDTCYSGTTRSNNMLISSRPIVIVAKEQAIPNNFTVFTIAAGDQIAKPLIEAKHGLFSYFLMKGMEGEANANNDNIITVGELHDYVKQNVIQQSAGSQTPELLGDANRH